MYNYRSLLSRWIHLLRFRKFSGHRFGPEAAHRSNSVSLIRWNSRAICSNNQYTTLTTNQSASECWLLAKYWPVISCTRSLIVFAWENNILKLLCLLCLLLSLFGNQIFACNLIHKNYERIRNDLTINMRISVHVHSVTRFIGGK